MARKVLSIVVATVEEAEFVLDLVPGLAAVSGVQFSLVPPGAMLPLEATNSARSLDAAAAEEQGALDKLREWTLFYQRRPPKPH